MADAKSTQKQIAEKYKDNLDYYRRGHIWRHLRLLAFGIAVLGSVAMVFGFRHWGKEEFFSTGPISTNHARFANQCEVCHDDVQSDVGVQLEQAIAGWKQFDLTSLGQIKQ